MFPIVGWNCYQGLTRCCVFTGIMDSISYQQILKDCLLPFTARRYPNGFRLYQDNDAFKQLTGSKTTEFQPCQELLQVRT
ncbi:hypothetical protein DPMN_118195 [Dreissena polymorpha]|uniref:Uncharacterized protein n=1 Tax=Dreissena polymorpha TaxID=45954 RepID=A0A9D4GJQ9_DREPO|nr:hypothetical protein DPMN_118195 [Dreissena polymorpha]